MRYCGNTNYRAMSSFLPWLFVDLCVCGGGGYKKDYGVLNLSAPVNEMYIFQCVDKIFCVEFQRGPLKFHTKYHTLKDAIFIQP